MEISKEYIRQHNLLHSRVTQFMPSPTTAASDESCLRTPSAAVEARRTRDEFSVAKKEYDDTRGKLQRILAEEEEKQLESVHLGLGSRWDPEGRVRR